jgi:penicillin-binding protein 2
MIFNMLPENILPYSNNYASSHDAFENIIGDSTDNPKDPNQGTRSWTAQQESGSGSRLNWLIAAFGILFLVLLFQLWQLQVSRGSALAVKSEYNTLSREPVFASRGSVLDRNGEQLAWTQANGTSSQLIRDRNFVTKPGFGHLLGYVNFPEKDANGNYYRKKMIGQAGVEAGYNQRLQSQPGQKIISTNAVGEVVSESTVSAPQPGKDLQLSIDAQVQEKLYSLIKQTAEERNYTGGAGVLMDIDSGELISSVSYPGFDSNKITENQQYLNQLQAATSSPFLNRVSEGIFTPGSVVKPFMATAALNEGLITPQTTIVSTGDLRIQNPYDPDSYTIFQDWKAHGAVNLQEAIAVSSNVYFYQIGGGFEDQPGLGIDNIVEYSHDFGLGTKTGIEGLPESTGLVPTPEWKQKNFADGTWRLGDTYNTAIGQYGYQVTPLQMARGIAGIAREGTLPTPTLEKGDTGKSTEVETEINLADYRVVKAGMRQAVTSNKGTANNLDVGYTDIAAKTGTAELGGENTGINSWIVGFYPYQDPQYAFTVVMSDGDRNNVVGGLYVMRQMLDWMHEKDMPYIPSNNSNQ